MIRHILYMLIWNPGPMWFVMGDRTRTSAADLRRALAAKTFIASALRLHLYWLRLGAEVKKRNLGDMFRACREFVPLSAPDWTRMPTTSGLIL